MSNFLMSKRSNIDLEAVMDTVLDGLVIIDNKGIIQAFNPAAVKIFGYAEKDVVGKNIKMLMPDPYHSEHDGYLSNYAETKEKKIIGIGREVLGKRKDGSIFPMDLGVNEMKTDEGLMFVGTIRDISERKESERKILDYMDALKRSNEELDEFAYIASHDLKEPLRGVSNNAMFLEEDYESTIDDDGKRRFARIRFLCDRMERLIDDLLYFSRIGRQNLAIKSVDLNDAVKDVILMTEQKIIENSCTVTLTTILPTVICDSVRIMEVFRNLISNGMKYNKNVKQIIEISHTEDNDFYYIHVADNGIGIDEKFHEDIFRIFKRLNDEDDNIKGTGVGLTFVKKIVERHGGDVKVQSTPGEGTTFSFSISKKIKTIQ